MEYKKVDNKYIVRIDKGEEVITKITELCDKENITLGSITGLGATNKVKVGLFNTDTKEYQSTVIEKPLEITSLVGNISTKDKNTYLHIHINVADDEFNVYGGHLNECYISATCEIIIEKIKGTVERELNEEIGLNLYKF